MYWIRTTSPLGLLVWLIMAALIWLGGWLATMYAFRLRRGESLIAGFAAGLLLFIVLSNLLAQLLPLEPAFWGGAALVLLLGAAAAAGGGRDRRRIWQAELRAWPQVLVLTGLIVLFVSINHGLAIFDDYHNLPLVSVIAAGDVPPHFYLNPAQRLAYHYGLHLFAASLVRVGGLFPWSALDLSKAISLALAVMLAGLWMSRAARSAAGGVLGAILALFGGGTRWLLLLLPAAWLVGWGARLQLLGSAAASGADLFSVLASPWKIEGAGPYPFPFAFANGIMPPALLALGGPGALPQVAAALLLLLARRRWRLFPAVLFGLLLASLALTGEHLLAMIWAGLFLAGLLLWRNERSRQALRNWGVVLLVSAVLSVSAGGVVTEIARGLLPGSPAADSFGFAGFGLRWPPALLSAHLGSLTLTDPAQVVIALAEIGPLILLLPWLVACFPRQLRRGRWVWSGLLLGSLLGLVLPVFIRYGVERDISRLTGSALHLWILLGFPLAWLAIQRGSRWLRALGGLGYGIAILGGLALFSVELIAIPYPQLTYFAGEADAQLSQALWDGLEPGAQVLDLGLPYRAVTLFGRAGGRAYQDLYHPYSEWEALVADPRPSTLAQAGYAYVYIDKATWQALSFAFREAFQQPCVRLVGERGEARADFRRLVDIRGCK